MPPLPECERALISIGAEAFNSLVSLRGGSKSSSWWLRAASIGRSNLSVSPGPPSDGRMSGSIAAARN